MSIDITNDNPIEIPAKEAQVYDKLYIKNFRIVTKGVNDCLVAANLIPFNGVDTLEEPITSIVIDNVFEAMVDENRPAELRQLLQQAMGVILMAIIGEKDYQKAEAKRIANLPPVEPIAEIGEGEEPIIEEDDTNNTQLE